MKKSEEKPSKRKLAEVEGLAEEPKSSKKAKASSGKTAPAPKNRSTSTDQKSAKQSKKGEEAKEEEKKEPKVAVAPPSGGDPLESYENFIAELGSWQQPLSKFLA